MRMQRMDPCLMARVQVQLVLLAAIASKDLRKESFPLL